VVVAIERPSSDVPAQRRRIDPSYDTFSRIVRRRRDFLIELVDPAVTDVDYGPRPYLFHFSLRSRCTAMLPGLRTLIQTGHGPDW
jgi:hypothetical protein